MEASAITVAVLLMLNIEHHQLMLNLLNTSGGGEMLKITDKASDSNRHSLSVFCI